MQEGLNGTAGCHLLRGFDRRPNVSGKRGICAPLPNVPGMRWSASTWKRPPGARNDRQERKRVIAMAQARQIDAVLVTEISRWGRSTKDLLATLDELHDRSMSVLPLNGQSFDIGLANGRLMRTIISALARIRARPDQGACQIRPGAGQGDHRQGWPLHHEVRQGTQEARPQGRLPAI